MTTLVQINRLIEYYTLDIQDCQDNIHEPMNEHQDYYEGRLQQLIVVVNDLQELKKSCSQKTD
jgi:hypothetical protein